jgi:hypothetical protein
METYGDYYNLRSAVRDSLEANMGALARVTGRAIKRFGAPSYWNAMYKVVGTKIVRDFLRTNRDYMQYLSLLPAEA